MFRWASKNGREDVARKIVEEGDGAAQSAFRNAIIQGDIDEAKAFLLASNSLVDARLDEVQFAGRVCLIDFGVSLVLQVVANCCGDALAAFEPDAHATLHSVNLSSSLLQSRICYILLH